MWERFKSALEIFKLATGESGLHYTLHDPEVDDQWLSRPLYAHLSMVKRIKDHCNQRAVERTTDSLISITNKKAMNYLDKGRK